MTRLGISMPGGRSKEDLQIRLRGPKVLSHPRDAHRHSVANQVLHTHTQLYQVTSPAACKSSFGLWKTFHVTNYNQLSWFNFQTVPSTIITSNHPTKPSSLTLFSVYDEVNVSNPLKKKHRHSQSSSCWCSSQICNAALQALATAQLPKALERATLCGVKPNSWRCDNCLGK